MHCGYLNLLFFFFFLFLSLITAVEHNSGRSAETPPAALAGYSPSTSARLDTAHFTSCTYALLHGPMVPIWSVTFSFFFYYAPIFTVCIFTKHCSLYLFYFFYCPQFTLTLPILRIYSCIKACTIPSTLIHITFLSLFRGIIRTCFLNIRQ